MGRQLAEYVTHVVVGHVALEVRVEQVLPREAGFGTRLQLGQVETVLRQQGEA